MIVTHKAHAPVACAMEGVMKILLVSTGSIETPFNGQAADGSVRYRCTGRGEVHTHDHAAQESHDE
jgi:hypothetical protein